MQRKNVRSCIACRKRDNPTALLRTVCIEGKILPDPQAIAPGRGAWVHRKCAVQAIERGAFGRAFRLHSSEAFLDGAALQTFIDLEQ